MTVMTNLFIIVKDLGFSLFAKNEQREYKNGLNFEKLNMFTC